MRLALLDLVLRVTTSPSNDLVGLRVEGELRESTTHEVEELWRSYLNSGAPRRPYGGIN
jgi:hypothetical protein